MRISDWSSDVCSSDLELVLDRIDRGDPEQIADAAVSGRTASLAQDAAPPAFGDDRIDGQEIGRIGVLIDQTQLVIDMIAIGMRQAAREHATGSRPDKGGEGFRGGTDGRRVGTEVVSN